MKIKFIALFLFFLSASIAFGQLSNQAHELDPNLLNKSAEVLDKKVVPPGSKGSALLINQFASGPSSTELDFLNSESFAPVQTQRLKNARIAWLNYDLLRDLGFQVPAGGLTPELETAILDAFAYVVPNDRISADKFLPTKKTFYADRYGGSGTGHAEGSGRAAAAGMFQIKGIGRTPLAEELKKNKEPIITWNPKSWNPVEIYKRIKAELSEIHHSHGGATLREGLAEAIWGEVLQRELPFGSNRVLAVIMTDLSIGAFGESRALIVRENSLRPAHFIQTEKGKDLFSKKERARVTKLTEKLKQFILDFIPQNYGTEAERFILGQKVLVHRITQKFAAEYTHSLFHGSTSPSNIDLRGTALDLGPMTALNGFEQALFADDYPNGDTRNIKETILFEFFDDLKLTMPGTLKKSVLGRRSVSSIINAVFEENIQKELLWFIGTPRELIDQVWERDEAQSFAEQLLKLARSGNDEIINVRFKVGKDHGTYDIRNIMKTLAASTPNNIKETLTSLKEDIPDEALRNKILKLFAKFDTAVTEIALSTGYSSVGFQKFQSTAAEIRNKKMSALMRGTKYFIQFFSEIWKYRIANNRSTLFNFVNRIIESNRRAWLTSSPKFLVVAEKKHHESGAVLQQVIDGVTGEERIELTAPIINDHLVFFDKKMTLADLRSQKIDLILGKNSLSVSSIQPETNQVLIKFKIDSKILSLEKLSSYSRVAFVESKQVARLLVQSNTPSIQEEMKLDKQIEDEVEDFKNQQEQALSRIGLSCQRVFLSY